MRKPVERVTFWHLPWRRDARYAHLAPETFIGSADHAFERLCVACEALGMRPPDPDDPEVTGCRYGAFVSSIISQLRATSGMTDEESIALIRYSLQHSLYQIERMRPTAEEVWRPTAL